MIKLFLGNSMWHLVMQADMTSRLVLLFLFGLSVICWSIFFYKLILLRVKKRQMLIVSKHMMNVTTFEQLLEVASTHSSTLPGFFLTKNLTFLKSMLSTPDGESKRGLTALEFEMVQQHADQIVDDLLLNEESYMPILSTTAVLSPLLGLFGTVWGLIQAFVRISTQQNADLITIAPGMAGALITTLAGLVVAIPAYAMFSYCSTQVRSLDRYLTSLSEQFMVLVQRLMLS